MRFRLDPPSGHADSYLDIRFIVDFDRSDKAEVTLYNNTLNQPLEVLAVSHGFILDGKIATIRNGTSIEGFINIFNRDKMNSALKNYTSIDVRCELKLFNKDELTEHMFVETFYNESKSLDASVLPFDIVLHNPEIDLATNQPLRLSFVSSQERFYELCLMDEQENRICTFDVVAKQGKTDFVLPSEIIFSDLGVSSLAKPRTTFDLFWTKFEGVDYSKFANRKRIRIPDCRITIIGTSMMPRPQQRMGPIEELPSNFVLSDRYFVHTYRDFSGFGAKNFDSLRMKRLTFLHYEALDMNQNNMIPTNAEGNIINILSEDRMMQHRGRIKTFGVSKQKNFLSMFTPVFAKHGTGSTRITSPQKQPQTQPGGCAGCGRKTK
jgi:hypothetical protein